VTAVPSRPAVDDSLVGALLGARYLVGDLLGRGGVASVYRATDTALGREVAVKVFRGAEGLDDPERRRSETALLASLAHPSLVMLHDAVREPGTGREFLVMELVEGPNLHERLHAQGPLGADEAAAMAVELGEALHVIHARGIVHRDVKPANVLLAPSAVPTRPWHAKLADFGIARLVDDARLTATGGLIGTPAYLAPEQVRGQGACAASDVYALGLLLLESRTGRPVFPGPALEAAGARLTRDPELPAFLGPDWRELVAAMLAREPGDRPTALEVAVAAAALGPDVAGAGAGAGAQAVAGADAGVTTGGDAAANGPEPAATAMVEAHELDEFGAAPTMLLGAAGPGALRAPSDGAAPAQPAYDARAGAEAGGRRRERPGGRTRGWLVPAGVLAVLAAVAVAAALLLPLLGGDSGGAADPTPAPLPSVPGELGVHLEELEEAVTP